ncbi:MAG: hypothetical protein PHS86_09930 [Syntrophaceae bacterium]|nr:hypothetical protein [Syntrophaceae bacterium]
MFSFRSFAVNGVNYAQLELDGAKYDLEWKQNVVQVNEAPRIVVISHVTNQNALDLLHTCIQGVKRFTSEAHELWIVDNNSPKKWLKSIIEIPWINWVLNRTEPRPPEARNLACGSEQSLDQSCFGSYANAIGLEIGASLIDENSKYLMTLHMDTMPVKDGWLTFLKSKLDSETRAAGMRMDHTRTVNGVLHVLGYMVDFQLFRRLDLNFFPKLPGYDVGDQVTVRLREAGYKVFACRNTFWDQELINLIPRDSPMRDLNVDRSFDDNDEVIFLHLGRGVRRSSGSHTRGTSVEEWLEKTNNILSLKK